MKLHQNMAGNTVLASYHTNSGTILLMERQKGAETEYIVGCAWNGHEWTHGQYFHSLDYGTAGRAHAAAKGAFLYRSGLDTSTNPQKQLKQHDDTLRSSGVSFIIVGNHPSGSKGPNRKTLVK